MENDHHGYYEVSYLRHLVTEFRTEIASGSVRRYLVEIPKWLADNPGAMITELRKL